MVGAATPPPREQLRDFLRSRRERIGPGEVGLPVAGRRRTPDLRREEVAMLAGVSVEYYTRVKRGNLKVISDSVLTLSPMR
nr:helix-turn-helix domain-containing protein [Nocardia fluminea]